MKLKDLNKFKEIVIQIHDNPDADAVGSGYAMYQYFVSEGKEVRLVYSGRNKVSKSNMVLFIKSVGIPLEHVKELENVPELLLTVDCQYGEGNVTRFEAKNIAMIDHHNTGKSSDKYCEIRSNLVSCATICYDMLRREKPELLDDRKVATSLYYGLFMDSNELSEIRHPLDRDMIDLLKYDKKMIKKFCYANFTLDELEIAGIAMLRNSVDENRRFTIINSKPCDPNILGVIGDIVLQVDSIDVSVIFNDCGDGYRLSIRSCAIEAKANDLARYMTYEIGDGGGHLDKAGGYISKELYEQKYGKLGIDTYFHERMKDYYNSFSVVHADEGVENKEGFKRYVKKKLMYGVVKTTDIGKSDIQYKLRTLEGDVMVKPREDTYIMIGHQGEVHPIEKHVFENNYILSEEKFERNFEYEPVAINMNSNRQKKLLNLVKSCYPIDEKGIYAKQLDSVVKVFTKWEYESYMLGDIGDYLCYMEDDEHDVYIIKKVIFEQTYEER